MPYPIKKPSVASGFSDVGFRLAFSAPGAVVGRNRLIALIRSQPYTRPSLPEELKATES